MTTAPTHDRDYVQPHYVYRCYDEAGRLLYVGCTVDVPHRILGHLHDQRRECSLLLQKYMHHHTVDPVVYAGFIAGGAAERKAIREEEPLFNIHHTRRPEWLRLLDLSNYERSLDLPLADRQVAA